VGEGRNGEGQGKFNGKLDVVSERTGRGAAKCVARKKRNFDGRKKERKKRERDSGAWRCVYKVAQSFFSLKSLI